MDPILANVWFVGGISFINIGKSPARDLQVYAAMKFALVPTREDVIRASDLSFLDTQNLAVIGGGFTQDVAEDHYVATQAADNLTYIKLNPAQLSALKKGDAIIAVSGMAFYSDIFGDKHETDACYFLNNEATGVLNLCSDHNHIR